jgi:Leucine-rich repeat (LRR) protein
MDATTSPLQPRPKSIQQAITAAQRTASLTLNFLSLDRIPEQVLCLYHLKELSLQNNRLSQLPPELSALKALYTLDVRWNAIQSITSHTIAHLTNLTHLDMSFNQLTEIPSSIGALVSLVQLKLSDNHLVSHSIELIYSAKLSGLHIKWPNLTHSTSGGLCLRDGLWYERVCIVMAMTLTIYRFLTNWVL